MKCQCQECGKEYKFVKRSEVSFRYCPTCEDIYLRMIDELSYGATAEAMLEDPIESCNTIAEFFEVNPKEEDAVEFVLSLPTEELMKAVAILFGPEYSSLFGCDFITRLRRLHSRGNSECQPSTFSSKDIESAEEESTPLILSWPR